ncbi:MULTISPECIES: hypothetical protein [Chelativorans]|jgi:hypothetical protein|uniref:Uncharacterized protein n=1 Tax=Chelativorans sp. (strain BNC1) TaxID=266779 RepID=Q11N71_CHESB|nr:MULTISPECIES: hypothetical protein [Chelativorans]
MRRQVRPFVVEVKKKRGDQARKRSIWGGLDLSVVAAETVASIAEMKPQQRQVEAIERPSTSGNSIVSIPAMTMPQIDQDVGTRDLELERADEPPGGEERQIVVWKRRGRVEALPRGQKWKRRLPKVLRRRK